METNKLEIPFKNYKIQHNELEQPYYAGDLLSLVNNKVYNENNNGVEENSKEIVSLDRKEHEQKQTPNNESNYDVYEIILDKIKESLKVELLLNEFKEKFNVNKKQVSDWLNRAIKDRVVKKITQT